MLVYKYPYQPKVAISVFFGNEGVIPIPGHFKCYNMFFGVFLIRKHVPTLAAVPISVHENLGQVLGSIERSDYITALKQALYNTETTFHQATQIRGHLVQFVHQYMNKIMEEEAQYRLYKKCVARISEKWLEVSYNPYHAIGMKRLAREFETFMSELSTHHLELSTC